MTEESGAGQGSGQSQGGTGTQTQEQGGAQQQGSTTQQQGGAQEETFDKDRAMATIKAQRDSEAKAISDLRAAEKRLKELEDEKLTEDERKTARLTEAEKEKAALEARVTDLLTDGALKDAAAAAGATKPAAVATLADRSAVKRGEDGSVTNAADVVEKVKKAYPELFGTVPGGSADGGARKGNEGGSENMNDWLRKRASR